MTAFVTRCVRCRQQRCICAEVAPVVLRTRFVIVRHFAERARLSNTAHFAWLATGCELYDYGGRERFDETRLPSGEGTWLLYPDGKPKVPSTPPAQVIVLDGSWSQARRMRHRLIGLRNLPTLSLPPPDPTRRRSRRPTHAYGMSTLEAIAQAVELLEGPEPAAALERLHDVIVGADTNFGFQSTRWERRRSPAH